MKSLIITIIFFILSTIITVAVAALQKPISKHPFRSMLLTLFGCILTLQIVIIILLQ
jgi:uncharacterized protein YacL